VEEDVSLNKPTMQSSINGNTFSPPPALPTAKENHHSGM